MKLGLVLSVFTPDPAKPMASAGRAAAAGYDAVFASDHLFPPGAPDRPSLEPYTLLAEAGLAGRGLRAGRPGRGGRWVAARAGPLLPPGPPPVWVGGTKDSALGVAARAADGWNAWGLGADTFVARAGELARLATGA